MANEELRVINQEKANCILREKIYELGIHNTTKEMIARESGLSMATIARYYPTKDDMVNVVLSMISDNQRARCDRITGNGMEQLSQCLQVLINDFLSNWKEYILRMDLICYAHFSGSDVMIRHMESMGYRKIMENIFRLGKEDGTIKTILDYDKAATYYSNIIFGYMSNIAMVHDMNIEEEKKNALFILNHLFETIIVELK